MPRIRSIFPAMACFAVMGIVDYIGTAVSNIREEYGMSDTSADLVQMLVFVWFAIFSIPSGFIMGKAGRRNTVVLSAVLTAVACFLVFSGTGMVTVVSGLVLIGISNTVMQVSLNPLAASFVSRGSMSSVITLGQFVRYISSLAGPALAALSAALTGEWRYVFAAYALLSVFSAVWLAVSVPDDTPSLANRSTFTTCLHIFRDSYIIKAFIAVIMAVGIDVSMNTYVPLMLADRFSLPVDKASAGSAVLYLAARMGGTLLGVFLLRRIRDKKILVPAVAITALSVMTVAFSPVRFVVLCSMAVTAFASSCIFPVVYSSALKYSKAYTNEISSLMIAGLCGGSVVPPLVGLLSDMAGISVGLSAMAFPVIYLLYFSARLK